MFAKLLRTALYWLFVWPLTAIVLGVWVRNRQRLPVDGPAIVVANHNSNLDVLMAIKILPKSARRKVRPVGAADYWLKFKPLAWFCLNVARMIPICRGSAFRPDQFDPISEALARGEIVILFPEGTRGEPEKMGELKKGISHLAAKHPGVPIVPVFFYGLGKTLARGEGVLVPFRCDAYVGEALRWEGDRQLFMDNLRQRFATLMEEARIPAEV